LARLAHERDRFRAEIVWKRVEVSEISGKRLGLESLWPSGRICAGKGDLSINNKAMLGTDPFTTRSHAPAKNREIFGILKLSCCQKGAYTTDKGKA
jgi:hypothetical protein